MWKAAHNEPDAEKNNHGFHPLYRLRTAARQEVRRENPMTLSRTKSNCAKQ
jgi:hypothetical protein